jgi:hypothetical protein
MRGDNEQLLIQADNLNPVTTGVKSQAVKGRGTTHTVSTVSFLFKQFSYKSQEPSPQALWSQKFNCFRNMYNVAWPFQNEPSCGWTTLNTAVCWGRVLRYLYISLYKRYFIITNLIPLWPNRSCWNLTLLNYSYFYTWIRMPKIWNSAIVSQCNKCSKHWYEGQMAVIDKKSI